MPVPPNIAPEGVPPGMVLVGLSFLFPGVETHGRAMTVGSPQRSP